MWSEKLEPMTLDAYNSKPNHYDTKTFLSTYGRL